MEICNFEIAKKLKEKGFNKNCSSFYALDNFTAEYIDDCGDAYEVDFEKGELYLNYPIKSTKFKDKMLDAPTISQVLKWLREEKLILIGLSPMQEYDGNEMIEWCSTIYKADKQGGMSWMEELYYESYEQAALAGIEYILDNLI